MTSATDPHADLPVVTAGAALTDATVAVIAIHGRGASPLDILMLESRLAHRDVAWLAPTAAGRRWYPHRFIAEIAANEPDLGSALRRIETLVDEILEAGIPHDRIVFLGFSQGACLSSEFVARQPRRWGGLVMLSGGLIGPPGTTWTTPGSLAGTPVFIGCSDVDAHIPLARVEESAQVLTRLGGDVTLRIYPGMAHTVNADELDHARSVLDRARVRQ
ncbi:MAG: phospholipase [Acidobacteria bacterium SCN 69-37]|nr:MAG: phospholipase [Acidobacteria bacterium SCN 69-37]